MRQPIALALTLALFAGAAQAAPTAEKVERPEPTRVVVTWTSAQPVDVYVAQTPDAPLSAAKLVSDDDKDGRFEFATAAGSRPYFLLRDGDGKPIRVAERALPLQQGSNFRDLGGYPAAGGKRVKWGRIFRSGATPMLTKADLMMIKALGLSEMVDLRSSEERSLAPSRIEGVRYTAVGYSMMGMMQGAAIPGEDQMAGFYRQMPMMLTPQFKALFAELLRGDGAVAYNCSAGQDRTGIATALILSALGTPRDVILADYHLSTVYRRPEFEMPEFDAATQASNPVARMFASFQKDPAYKTPRPLVDGQGKALLESALAEIDARYGSVDAFLDKELGVGAADVKKLRAMYLE
jgi:protein-tyrosine phosphatase